VSIAAGEQLTERQALQALLLPSANNIAAVLARWDAGSVDRFVARMNATARSLGMTHTRYTDPSGYDDATVSTAADQVRIVDRAMRLPVFASIVATPSATLPVAGTVHNTNTLLGHDGFVGVKTGSTAAAGGCFAFRAIRWIDGKRTTITGVVLGQPGHDRSRRVSRQPPPWSTASPVIHGAKYRLCRIYDNEPWPPRTAAP
jgi:D-alanyl-D-alanine carboxypeptidase (penicillin-binding protein 5/6)